ncbi:hypothetical protein [Georgenia sp. H159]|uniref:hypothetical protein n=1 Tax=Georgenia sp. H159 TaxID=3076115 RepID=UPI002D78F1FD|nr:hypothetical protein [Georgenia sp. H159]
MPSQELREAPTEEQVRAANRPLLWFSLVLLAALWLSVTRPPWPLPLVPGLLALLAIVLGVVGLVRARRARLRGGMTVLVVIGMGVAAAMVLLTGVQALLWPVYADFHACLDRALTHRAEDACLSELEDRAQSFLFDLAR